MSKYLYLAADLGAESGRVILGRLEGQTLTLEDVHRFPNLVVKRDDHIYWDLPALEENILTGLRQGAEKAAASDERVAGVSTDTWGVDYVWVDSEILPLGSAFCYRDSRTDKSQDRLYAKMPLRDVYAETGIQIMAINTIYQLEAEVYDGKLAGTAVPPAGASCLLNIADYFNARLSGKAVAEESLASTSQVYNPVTRTWSKKIIEVLGLPEGVFPPVVPSGSVIAPLFNGEAYAKGVGKESKLEYKNDDAQDAIRKASRSWIEGRRGRSTGDEGPDAGREKGLWRQTAGPIKGSQGEQSESAQEFAGRLASLEVSKNPYAYGDPLAHMEQLVFEAKKHGFYLSEEDLEGVKKLGPDRGGEEHHVYLDDNSGRFYKITKHDFGPIGINNDSYEYLDRLAGLNTIYPAMDYQIHGVTETKGLHDGPEDDPKGAIVSSMAGIRPVNPDCPHPPIQEIEERLRDFGFEKDNLNQWWDKETGTVIRDVKPDNFIKAGIGIVPIDVDIKFPAGAREVLARRLESQQRRRSSLGNSPAWVGTQVIATCSHDTGAAVAAVPAKEGKDWAYLSSGTWSLVGAELPAPLLTDAAREAGFTNEAGVAGTTRFLKNIVGLWIVQECRRDWEQNGRKFNYDELTQLAAAQTGPIARIDAHDPRLLSPGNMPAKIEAICKETGQPVPGSPGATIRCALESLAAAYADVMRNLEALTGQKYRVLHIVGGGAKNELLNQLTADATGLEVVAGPVEGTAIGNILIQALALGHLSNLAELRSVVRQSFSTKIYLPNK